MASRLLERNIIIENLADYFFVMGHRYQLAFLEDNPYLWETEIHGVSSTEAWETYKTTYIDELIRYYTKTLKAQRLLFVQPNLRTVILVWTVHYFSTYTTENNGNIIV